MYTFFCPDEEKKPCQHEIASRYCASLLPQNVWPQQKQQKSDSE